MQARASGEPGAAKINRKIPIHTWFDVKQVVTHVEVQSPDFGAKFTTRGYRTDPPAFVTLFFKTDEATELKLADGKTDLGSFKSSGAGSTPNFSASARRFNVPRKVFEQWIKSSQPSAQWGKTDFSPVDEKLEALRELARRMVTHKSLTLLHGRESLTATPLPDGRVLVAGGYDGFRALSECEIYDPVIGRFTPGPSMKFPRRGHTATMLNNGKILIAGGGVDGGDTALDSAELFDPATNRFAAAGKMRDSRMNHTATLLSDGRVLVAGGGGKTPLAGAEIYDPATNAFHPTGDLLKSRLGHTATRLGNGRVLIAGGVDGEPLKSVELYDPAQGSFSAADAMSSPRWEHVSLMLPDGTVWIDGGHAGANTAVICNELFSAEGKRRYTRCYDRARWGHIVILTPNDHPLLVGGSLWRFEVGPQGNSYVESNDQSGLDEYAEQMNLHSVSSALLAPRRHFAAAPLKDGRWLLIGGVNQYQPAINTAEFYDPKTDEIIPWRDEPGGGK